MAALAEAPTRREVYAQSQAVMYEMGRLTVAEAFDEIESLEALVYTDFHTRIAEHIKTDQEFRHELDIAHVDHFDVVGNQVIAKNGLPMVTLIEGGLAASKQAAQEDARMQVQVMRDSHDVRVAKIVDGLQPGELYQVVSMDPKKQLAADRKFWEGKNYREGIAYIQAYYKLPDGSGVLAGAYSVDHSDIEAWRHVQAQHGVEIPAGTSENDWISYGERRFASQEEALQAPLGLRNAYYQEVGKGHKRASLSEYLQYKKATIDSYFGAYIKPLSEAIATGRNNGYLQSFAGAILRTVNPRKLDAVKLQEIIKAANCDDFSDETGRVMEEVICYALVEELRAELKQFIAIDRAPISNSYAYTQPMEYVAIPITYDQIHVMNSRAVQRVDAGVTAGRSYGGCSGASLGADLEANESDDVDSQDVYGGKAGETSYKFDKKMFCVVCQAPPKKNEDKKMCGPCGICKGCDKKLSKKTS